MGLAGMLLGSFWGAAQKRYHAQGIRPSQRRTVWLIFVPDDGWSWEKFDAYGRRTDQGVATGLHLDARTYYEAKADQSFVRTWAKQEWPGHDIKFRILSEETMARSEE